MKHSLARSFLSAERRAQLLLAEWSPSTSDERDERWICRKRRRKNEIPIFLRTPRGSPNSLSLEIEHIQIEFTWMNFNFKTLLRSQTSRKNFFSSATRFHFLIPCHRNYLYFNNADDGAKLGASLPTYTTAAFSLNGTRSSSALLVHQKFNSTCKR